jgi:hypothetical protein
LSKNKKSGLLSLPGKPPAPNKFSRFIFEIWEREAAPAELMPDIFGIYGRLLSESAAENIDA